MQYVPGRSLQARVDEDGPLAVEEILRIGMQAAAGLAAAHAQGLVHRDVKPSNILLEDTVERAVLTDFGLARAMDDASLTQTGILAGHAALYVARAGDRRRDRRTLGFVQPGCRAVFHGDGASAVSSDARWPCCIEFARRSIGRCGRLNKDVPDELAKLIDRLLEKKPAGGTECGECAPAVGGAVEPRAAIWQRAAAIRRLARATSTAQAAARVRRGNCCGGGSRRSGSRVAGNILQPQAHNLRHPAVGADAIVAAEQGYDAEMQAARQGMKRATDDSFYLHGDDPWRREIADLKRDLDRAESHNQ